VFAFDRFDKRRTEEFYDKEQATAFTPSVGLGIGKLFVCCSLCSC